METKAKRLRKYSAISLAVVLVTAFILVQPLQVQAEEITIKVTPLVREDADGDISGQAIPGFECGFIISVNTDPRQSSLLEAWA